MGRFAATSGCPRCVGHSSFFLAKRIKECPPLFPPPAFSVFVSQGSILHFPVFVLVPKQVFVGCTDSRINFSINSLGIWMNWLFGGQFGDVPLGPPRFGFIHW